MAELRGGYYWVALFADGTEEQQLKGGQEQSIERVRERAEAEAQPVVQIHLVPLRSGFAYIILEVGEGEDFIKHWNHSTVDGVSPEGAPIHFEFDTDELGLRPDARRTRKPVRFFVLLDGAIRITTAREPEGYYGEGSHHGHIIDRRYSLGQG